MKINLSPFLKAEVEKMLRRRVTKLSHGGDRKSKEFLGGVSSDLTP